MYDMNNGYPNFGYGNMNNFQSPLMNDVFNQIQQNSGNPQAAFYNYAQQMGIDPNEIMSMLQGK